MQISARNIVGSVHFEDNMSTKASEPELIHPACPLADIRVEITVAETRHALQWCISVQVKNGFRFESEPAQGKIPVRHEVSIGAEISTVAN